MHQLIRQPIGFQTARENAVDEQLKLRETWAAIAAGEHSGPDRRRMRCAGSSGPFVRSPDWLRALNELPDQGIEALIDLIMLIEQKCGWPDLCNRIVFIAQAAGGVWPIGLLFAIVRGQCKLRRIEAKVWEASNSEGFF